MHVKKIACMGETLGSEPSKYQQEKKSKRDSPSSGERTGRSPNRRRAKRACVASSGLRDPQVEHARSTSGKKPRSYGKGLGRPAGEGESPVA